MTQQTVFKALVFAAAAASTVSAASLRATSNADDTTMAPSEEWVMRPPTRAERLHFNYVALVVGPAISLLYFLVIAGLMEVWFRCFGEKAEKEDTIEDCDEAGAETRDEEAGLHQVKDADNEDDEDDCEVKIMTV